MNTELQWERLRDSRDNDAYLAQFRSYDDKDEETEDVEPKGDQQ